MNANPNPKLSRIKYTYLKTLWGLPETRLNAFSQLQRWVASFSMHADCNGASFPHSFCC